MPRLKVNTAVMICALLAVSCYQSASMNGAAPNEPARASYRACTTDADCGGADAHCVAIRSDSRSGFCGDFCKEDSSCPTLPGFESACNLAWCSVVCDDGTCPSGMVCERDFAAVDFQGEVHGTRDICVVDPEPAG